MRRQVEASRVRVRLRTAAGILRAAASAFSFAAADQQGDAESRRIAVLVVVQVSKPGV